MAETLKLCPFCGGEAELVAGTYRDGGYLENTAYVRCKGCGLRTYEFHECKPPEDVQRYAVDVWNDRAELTCHMVHDYLTDTVFCDVCGERFDSVAQYMAMVPNGLSVTEYKPEYKDARYCPHCGAKVVGKR